jgi:hypothetical protein
VGGAGFAGERIRVERAAPDGLPNAASVDGRRRPSCHAGALSIAMPELRKMQLRAVLSRRAGARSDRKDPSTVDRADAICRPI